MDRRKWQNKSIFTALTVPPFDFGPTNSQEHDVISMSAHIRELEREVETLKAGMGKKDEALTLIKETHCNSLCAVLCDSATCVGPSTGTCDVLKISRAAATALSLTPASVAEYAANERAGRAAIVLRDQWRDRIKSDQPTTRREEAMWRELVRVIGDALHEAGEIAEAREAKP